MNLERQQPSLLACPRCGSRLAHEVAQGLCPRCLARAGCLQEEEVDAPLPPPALEERLTELLTDFEILEHLGVGGMGVVYKARQKKLDRLVAIKVLLPPPAEAAGWDERFEREARALARLSHPHITAVHDFGQVEDLSYLVMEYVEGANLRHILAEGRLSPAEASAIVSQLCEALQYAHGEGVVHRDIKPENILMDLSGGVKVVDFGLAKMIDTELPYLTLTGSRQAMGTFRYMAPEQIERPKEVDHRADIYSLGVVLYEMLTGLVPVGSFKQPSELAGTDPRLDLVVQRALEREPEARYQRASEIRVALEAAAADAPAPRPAEPKPGSSVIDRSRESLAASGPAAGAAPARGGAGQWAESWQGTGARQPEQGGSLSSEYAIMWTPLVCVAGILSTLFVKAAAKPGPSSMFDMLLPFGVIILAGYALPLAYLSKNGRDTSDEGFQWSRLVGVVMVGVGTMLLETSHGRYLHSWVQLQIALGLALFVPSAFWLGRRYLARGRALLVRYPISSEVGTKILWAHALIALIGLMLTLVSIYAWQAVDPPGADRRSVMIPSTLFPVYCFCFALPVVLRLLLQRLRWARFEGSFGALLGAGVAMLTVATLSQHRIRSDESEGLLMLLFFSGVVLALSGLTLVIIGPGVDERAEAA